MMANGIIGLFVGAVILALGYTLFVAWLNDVEVSTQDDSEPHPERNPPS